MFQSINRGRSTIFLTRDQTQFVSNLQRYMIKEENEIEIHNSYNAELNKYAMNILKCNYTTCHNTNFCTIQSSRNDFACVRRNNDFQLEQIRCMKGAQTIEVEVNDHIHLYQRKQYAHTQFIINNSSTFTHILPLNIYSNEYISVET